MKPEINWHNRYLQQSRWTHDLRQYLFDKSSLPEAESILELGCGTGAILLEIPDVFQGNKFGLDIDPVMIYQARQNTRNTRLTIGDEHHLPFPSNKIDITFCHFLLLWVRSPLLVLREMKRVTRAGGAVLVIAEPDYLERIDEPESLRALGQLQTESLVKQGAAVDMGSRLAELFNKAGIQMVEAGRLDRKPGINSNMVDQDLEWLVMEQDVKKYLSSDELNDYRKMDVEARRNGTRRIHVPTSFAWGLV